MVIQITKGTLFWIFVKEKGDESQWVKVQLDSGEHGYIPASAKVANLAQITYPAVQSPAYDVLVGLLWLIGGIVVTAVSYSAVSETGGTYFVFWGAVVFGGLQFLRGLFRAAVAEKPTIHDSSYIKKEDKETREILQTHTIVGGACTKCKCSEYYIKRNTYRCP